MTIFCMNLKQIVIQEVGRQRYEDLCGFWKISPRKLKQNKNYTVLWSEIKSSLVYPDYKSLIYDFLGHESADLIFVRDKWEIHRMPVRKIESEQDIERIINWAEENPFKRGFFELKFTNKAYAGAFPREFVLSFIEENNQLLLGSLSLPWGYHRWIDMNYSGVPFKFNNAVLSNEFKLVSYKKKRPQDL